MSRSTDPVHVEQTEQTGKPLSEWSDGELSIEICRLIGGPQYHNPTEAEVRSGSYYQYMPDYPNDLNAMHEAEKVLTREQQWDYIIALQPLDITNWQVVNSTARQRAIAFIQTLGLSPDTAAPTATGLSAEAQSPPNDFMSRGEGKK